MYINCSIDKIQNFGGCFFWYMVYIIQEIFNLMIVGFFSIIKSLLSIDLLPFYSQFLNIYGQVSDIFNEYTGFELFIFPYSNDINRKCFVCEVTNTKKKPIIKTFIDDVKKNIDDGKTYINTFNKNIAKEIDNVVK
jgi:hypothetical protein